MTDELRHSIIAGEEDKKNYAPLLDADSTIPTTFPLGTRDGLRLFDGTTTIDLRNPELGNSDNQVATRTFNTSRGGTINQFRKSTWPINTVRAMTFVKITDAIMQSLLTFVRTNVGKSITLTDFEDNVSTVIIMNPETTAEIENDCEQSITLEFLTI